MKTKYFFLGSLAGLFLAVCIVFLMKSITATTTEKQDLEVSEEEIASLDEDSLSMTVPVKPDYLTFTALESGSFTLTIHDEVTTNDMMAIYYSVDNGVSWEEIIPKCGEDVIITPTVPAGGIVLWKGTGTRMRKSNFSSTCKFEISGNIMSLLYGDDFESKTSLMDGGAFWGLFKDCVNLTSAEELKLPALGLGESCYRVMFKGCTSLTTAPELPATVMKDWCYTGMFQDCTSLKKAPKLPATTLADHCYQSMFKGCASLKTTPKLPATKLADQCYYYMFSDCTSLTKASDLPATRLAEDCYTCMFRNCTSLTIPPKLAVSTDNYYCRKMFGYFN